MKSNDFLSEDIALDAHEMHMDHEVQMARKDCYTAAENAIALHKLLRNVSEEQGLEDWVSAKITLANDYLSTVREHLEYQLMTMPPVAPVMTATLPIAESTITAADFAQLNEIDPRNYDSDEDYYNDRDGEDDDEDFDPDADEGDPAFVDDESYYEKSLRSRGLGESTGVTNYNPKDQGGTRKELLAKYAKSKSAKDAEAARKAGATQKELQSAKGVAEARDGDVNFGHTVTRGSWVVYNGSKVTRFKTHTGAKAYAEKNGGKVASSEFYADKIQKKGVAETSAGSVAGVVNPTPKNKAKVGTLFGGTYKQPKAK